MPTAIDSSILVFFSKCKLFQHLDNLVGVVGTNESTTPTHNQPPPAYHSHKQTHFPLSNSDSWCSAHVPAVETLQGNFPSG